MLGKTILAHVTRGLLASVDGRGPDRRNLLHDAGLSEEMVADPDAWIPIEQHVALGRAISAALPGQNLGLQTGARIFGDSKGALGYVVRRSEHHLRALRNFLAYLDVVNSSMTVGLSVVGGTSSFAVQMVPELGALGHPAEALFAAWVAISRHVTNSSWCPESVSFIHRPLGDTSEHQSFFGCPVLFGAEFSVMRVPGAAAALPISSDPHVLDPALSLAAADARKLVGDDAAALTALASTLATTPLEVRDQGVSRLAARLALAHGLLGRTSLCLHEVAYLLGFGHVSSLEGLFSARFGRAARELRASA